MTHINASLNIIWWWHFPT
ncbi:trpEGDC/F operon attenuation leader peptide, TrpL [Shewanella baltica OS223]|uniref:TrpEGDC/F operon attenuation leader peptide, TrpL n=1 Tax=Shewanella putrefaciens (strain 200) TaxID=399804 RepID=E6XQI9_SHEP2|nr:trpEGDC/F operon attenuation leader peptide, TrpL [Shewanella baltica OS223]ADT94956.1 hypothetical protein Sbal678_2806 [Shewanella baltica OS678]